MRAIGENTLGASCNARALCTIFCQEAKLLASNNPANGSHPRRMKAQVPCKRLHGVQAKSTSSTALVVASGAKDARATKVRSFLAPARRVPKTRARLAANPLKVHNTRNHLVRQTTAVNPLVHPSGPHAAGLASPKPRTTPPAYRAEGRPERTASPRARPTTARRAIATPIARAEQTTEGGSSRLMAPVSHCKRWQPTLGRSGGRGG